MSRFYNTVSALSTTDCTGANTGALQTAGGAYVAKQVLVGGVITCTSTVEATSTTNGALVVSGGGAFAKSLIVGLTVTAAGFIGSGSGLTAGTIPVTSLATTGTPSSTTVLCGDGVWRTGSGGSGMTNPMTTKGDTLYGDTGGTPARLAIGTVNQVYSVSSGGTPSWVSALSVTSTTVYNPGNNTYAFVKADTGKFAGYQLVNNAFVRTVIQLDQTGANTLVSSYDSTGTLIDSPISIANKSNGTVTFARYSTFTGMGTTNTHSYTIERTLSVDFTSGSNQKADIVLGNVAFMGTLEVSISATYNGTNAVGRITNLYSLCTNPDNYTYSNLYRCTEAYGPIVGTYTIGGVTWDSTNSVYRIQIIQQTSTAADRVIVSIRCICDDTSAVVVPAITIGSVYTTDTTVWPSSMVTFQDGISIPYARTPATTVDAIYNISGKLYFNGSLVSSPMTTLGDMVYENDTPTATRLAGWTAASMAVLTQTGTGSASAAPAWTLATTAATANSFVLRDSNGGITAGVSSFTSTSGIIATLSSGGNAYVLINNTLATYGRAYRLYSADSTNNGYSGFGIYDQTGGFYILKSDTTGAITLPNSTGSISTTTGALVVAGGVGVGEKLIVGGNISCSSLYAGESLTLANPRHTYITYDGTYYAVQAVQDGVGYRDLTLNPYGGNVATPRTLSCGALQTILSPSGSYGASKFMVQQEDATNTRMYFSGDGTNYGNLTLYTTTSTGSPLQVLQLSSSGAVTVTYALTVTGATRITPSLGAGTFSVFITGASGAARDIMLVGQGGFSNGFTVRYDGTYMVYSMMEGSLTVANSVIANQFSGSGAGLTGTAASLTAGAVAWTGVTGRPTALSAFTNDLGFLTSNVALSGCRGLTGSTTGSSAASTWSATEIIVTNSAGLAIKGSNVSVTNTLTTSGLNGLDTGSPAYSTWYYIYVIYNPSASTWASLASISSTSPTMPSGYTHKCLVSAIRTQSATNYYPLHIVQYGNEVQYVVAATGNVTAMPALSTGSHTWPYQVTLSGFVPPNASKVHVTLTNTATGSSMGVSPNNSSAYTYNSGAAGLPLYINFSGGSSMSGSLSGYITLESAYLYVGGTPGALLLTGYVMNF